MFKLEQGEYGFFWLDLDNVGINENLIRKASEAKSYIDVFPEHYGNDPSYSIHVLLGEIIVDNEHSIQVKCRVPEFAEEAILIYDKKYVGQSYGFVYGGDDK